MAAERVTPAAVNFMAKHGRGLVCLSLTEEKVKQLRLPLMVDEASNSSSFGTAFTAFLYGFYQRELIYDMFETISGQRFHPSYTRVGGLLFDVNDDFMRKVRDFVKNFPKVHADICRLLNRNRIFVERTRDVGVLTRENALSYAVTGPLARSAGIDFDVRKAFPYFVYDRIDFEDQLGLDVPRQHNERKTDSQSDCRDKCDRQVRGQCHQQRQCRGHKG